MSWRYDLHAFKQANNMILSAEEEKQYFHCEEKDFWQTGNEFQTSYLLYTA